MANQLIRLRPMLNLLFQRIRAHILLELAGMSLESWRRIHSREDIALIESQIRSVGL